MNKDSAVMEFKVKQKTKLETYQDDLTQYLSSKLENYNIPQCVLMEIAQYTYTQTYIVAGDEVQRAYKDWKYHMKRSESRARRRREEITTKMFDAIRRGRQKCDW